MKNSTKNGISVIILTKNEEKDLAECINSISWSDDVHVFDSYSDDNTVFIAESMGAVVTQNKFLNYANQRNKALHSLNFKHPWVLMLDADERIPDPLKDEMLKFVNDDTKDICACRIRRNDFFLGSWLKHAQISPFYIRLVRPSKVAYEREINEVLKVSGDIVDMKEAFDHYPFSKGIEHWLNKHNVYSTMEAKLINQTDHGEFSIVKAFFDPDFNNRRFHQKKLFYKLPFRPFIKLIYMMFIRGAILDGRAGVTYAFLQMIYEYMIVLKTRELFQEKQDK